MSALHPRMHGQTADKEQRSDLKPGMEIPIYKTIDRKIKLSLNTSRNCVPFCGLSFIINGKKQSLELLKVCGTHLA